MLFLPEELQQIKRAAHLIENGGAYDSYFGLTSDTKCKLTSSELAAFKSKYPKIEPEILKIYPIVLAFSANGKLESDEVIVKAYDMELSKILDNVNSICQKVIKNNDKEIYFKDKPALDRFVYLFSYIQKVADKNATIKNTIINYNKYKETNSKVNEILKTYTVLYDSPVDDFPLHERDVSNDLDSFQGSSLKVNIFGGIELEKGVRSFNYGAGTESSLNLPVPKSGEKKGKIEFIVDFQLTESFRFTYGYHSGRVNIFLNYTVQSYGVIKLAMENPNTQTLTNNNSFSKVSAIIISSNSDNNEIYIVVSLIKAASSSGGSVGVSYEFTKGFTGDASYSYDVSEANGVTTQLVFKLKLGLEKPSLEEPEIKNTKKIEFSDNSYFVRSEELSTLVSWWDTLSPAIQEKIKAKKAKIVITGYASPKGSTTYNFKLGDQRAATVKNHLASIIGKENDAPIAVIITEARGECTEDPQRYVMIKIEDNK